MTKFAWITWELQTRNRSMAQRLDAELYEFVSDKNPFARYFSCSRRTIGVFRSGTYSAIFVQNPSIVLTTMAIVLGRLYRVQVIVDAHNVGVIPDKGGVGLLKPLTRFVLRNAQLTIVSNDKLVKVVEAQGGRAFALPDPLPSFENISGTEELDDKFNVLLICTWSADEPYMEVIEAARLLGFGYRILITGRAPRGVQRNLPNNVTLVGFVSELRYLRLLNSVDAVVDLTTRDDCLVCGAYETIAVGQPLILSDTAINRQIFDEAALYTRNKAEEIAATIRQSKELNNKKRQLVKEFKPKYEDNWNLQKVALVKIIASQT